MTRVSCQSQKGAILLVALCFVTVLGIALASYVALCSRTMQISNRTAQTALSRQLAEMGIEEGLRAFNKNDWADWSNSTAADWTVSGTTATCNLTFPAGTFGQGVTGSVKIRVDNYNANQLSSTWVNTASYRPNDVVGRSGMWYRCIVQNSAQTPSATSPYWIQEQSPIDRTWTSSTSYVAGDMIYRNNTWYRCTTSHTSPSSWNGTNWTSIGTIKLYSASEYHAAGEFVYYPDATTWYLTTVTGTPGSFAAATNTNIAWKWTSGASYVIDDIVGYYSGAALRWYRCIQATSTAAPTDTNYWVDTQTTTAMTATNNLSAWSSTLSYNLNDIVYYSGSWYRCVLAHGASQTPSSTSSYWTNSPRLSREWDAGKQYSQNDTVSYKGVWYRSLQNSQYGQTPLTATSYWASATNSSYQWSIVTPYALNAYCSYGGVWYKCILANTGKSPNNTTYWTSAWAQASGITTGAPVMYAEGTVSITGGGSIKTQLRATLAPAPLHPNAVAATTNLTISGGGTVDSYDSVTDPSASSPGYSAVLASRGTTSPAVTVTSTTVNGYVAAPSASTSPYAPMWTYGGSAVVKGTSIGTGIDATRVSRSPYIPDFGIQAASGGTSFSSMPITLGIAGAKAPLIYYYDNAGTYNLRLNAATDKITVVGPVILYVNGNFRIDGNTGAKVTITPTGSLRLVVARDFNIESTGGGIENQTLDPSKLTVLCSRVGTDTFLYASTAQAFYGTIYMPNASSTLTISAGVTIYGALSAQNIAFSGDANVHYDTALRYASTAGIDQPYAISQWRELTDASELATMP